MKKLVRITEQDLHNIIKESVNKILREGEYPEEIGKLEDDNYYGGGLPEPQGKVPKYTCEKQVNQIYQNIKPYLDELADIFNENEFDDRKVYDEVMDALNVLDSLPSIGKQFYTVEYDY
jgi:hypothetical protein